MKPGRVMGEALAYAHAFRLAGIPKAAQMEKDIEDGLNSVGLGPGGFGGKLSVMGVNIEQAARHPATLAVGMSTACWAHRRAGIRINPDFTYDFFTHKGAVL